jgi:hypothetical protein
MEVEFMEREPFCNTIPDKPSDGGGDSRVPKVPHRDKLSFQDKVFRG